MLSKKGFTLIELMIVIAIIAIIAAIAIPNLMQSRIRANEATAVTALKNYCSAQVTYQVGKLGRATKNTSAGNKATAYTTNYRNLFYGNPVNANGAADGTKNIQLISKAHADAFVAALTATGAVNGTPVGAGANTPYQGYDFGNSKESQADAANFFVSNFDHVGYPTTGGTTGNNAYWVGIEGTVYMQGVDVGASSATNAAALVTPSVGGADAFKNWIGI